MARRVLHDQFFRKAKEEGYLARSAYKLIQINDAKRLIRRGDRVLDLGCAPGSWMQVAAQLVGPRGVVVGIDLKPVTHDLGPNVRHMVGDIEKTPASVLLAQADEPAPAEPASAPPSPSGSATARAVRAGGSSAAAPASDSAPASRPRRPFDVVLSDMAPDTIGHGDHERSVRLCERILDLLPELLRPGGNLCFKVFEGGQYPLLVKRVQQRFGVAKGYKPEASRDISVEMYVCATGYRG